MSPNSADPFSVVRAINGDTVMVVIYQPHQDVSKSDADYICNTVNCIGTMGKGVALAMKEAFPEIMPRYTAICRKRLLKPGALMIAPLNSGQTMLHLATKDNWRDPSRPEWVGSVLFYLNHWLMQRGVAGKSLCMSLPGAGNGGLDPATVQRMILTYLRPATEAGLELRLCAPERPVQAPAIYYAGVGARDTPEHILALMREIGELLAQRGWILRSGGAIGADTAFHQGALAAGARSDIFLAEADPTKADGIVDIRGVHWRLVQNIHPKPEALRGKGLALMARNGCQLFGVDFMQPSSALVCWTKGGAIVGGTGQALRLAVSAGLPILNLGRPDLAGLTAEAAVAMIAAQVEDRLLPTAA